MVLTDTLPPDISSDVTTSTSVAGVTASVAGGRVSADFGDLGVNASVTLTINVVPTAGAALQSPIDDSATVTNNEFNSTPNTVKVSTPILPVADLEISSFTALPSPDEYGNQLTYTAVVTNEGPSPAAGVSLSTAVNGQVTFGSGSWVSTSATSGTVEQSGLSLVATIGNLAVGASATVTIVVTPQEAAIGLVIATTMATENRVQRHGRQGHRHRGRDGAGPAGDFAVQRGRLFGRRYRGRGHHHGRSDFGAARAGHGQFHHGRDDRGSRLDYTPTAETVVFPAGVAQETVEVPVLDDPYDSHNVTVGLALSAPGGGAVLGSLTTATLTIVDLEPDHNSPTVTAVQWTGTATEITSLILSFSEPLAPATADNPNNFLVAAVGKKGQFNTAHTTPVSIGVPVYNPGNWTVTLDPAKPLASNQFYSLIIKGTAGGVTDPGGNPLAGAGPGKPGTNFTALLRRATKLTFVDAGGNKVTFTVQHGGYVQDLLTGSGLGQRLVMVGAVPHRTVLGGTVVQGRHGSGRSYLGYSVYGLGQFGDVRVNMQSPPFVVARYPFSPGLPLGTPTPTIEVAPASGTGGDAAAQVAAVDARAPSAGRRQGGDSVDGVCRSADWSVAAEAADDPAGERCHNREVQPATNPRIARS